MIWIAPVFKFEIFTDKSPSWPGNNVAGTSPLAWLKTASASRASAARCGPPGRRLRAPKKERSFGGVRS